jgi:hypothetical protein
MLDEVRGDPKVSDDPWLTDALVQAGVHALAPME